MKNQGSILKSVCSLDMFNVELSPEKCCVGLRSHELGVGKAHIMLHCHHQNDFCIMMDSDESQLSLIGQSHQTCIVGSVHRPQLCEKGKQ